MQRLWFGKIIAMTLAVAALYVMMTVYLMNASLVQDAIFGDHTLEYTRDILFALLFGMGTAMSGVSIFLLFTIALLTGANVSLLVERIRSACVSKKMQATVGGSSLLGIVGGGCAGCGLPVLALPGISGAMAYLPFQGIELSIVAIILLIVSLFSLMKSRSGEVCELVALERKSAESNG